MLIFLVLMPYWTVKGRQQRGQVGLPQIRAELGKGMSEESKRKERRWNGTFHMLPKFILTINIRLSKLQQKDNFRLSSWVLLPTSSTVSCQLANLRKTDYIRIIKCHTGNYEQMYRLPDIRNLFYLLNTGKISTQSGLPSGQANLRR